MNRSFKRKRIVIQLLLLCFMVLLLSGCWDRKEINDLALVVGVSIDKKKDGFMLSLQYIIPKTLTGQAGGMGGGGGGSGGEATTKVESGEGLTIADAMARLQEKIPRKIFWGHMKALVIGEDIAKEGITDNIDFFLRHPEPRMRTFVYVSKGKASKLLEVPGYLERFSSETIRELNKLRFNLEVTLKDLTQMIKSDAKAAALPWIEVVEWSSSHPERSRIRLNGAAILKNGKMVGYVDDYTTRGLLWIRNEVAMATITVQPSGEKGKVSLNMIGFHTKLVPQIEKGKWLMRIEAVTSDDVVENTTSLSMMNPNHTQRIAKAAGVQIEKRMKLALKKIQKGMNADIFGFSEAFQRKYPKEWDQAKDHWDEIFPKIEVKIDTKVYVRRPGASTSPAGIPEEEVKKK
ncbi:germination protein [Collibacillus ludicampi]|uniref:Germination protein n=1 Tax=Collibacillus ludicampi TaxID=2771369 RepID=A0AAV4LBC6_9BACL|nr:Ger(x)C family spore germination protein [Collibacillus ludicampi]GIM45009.1 germination protein [Collibacillus ludicampi]